MSWLDEYLHSVTKKMCACPKTKGGGRCYLTASVGSNYCRYHGGGDLARFIEPERANEIRTYTGSTLERYVLETIIREKIPLERLQEVLYGNSD